MISTRNEKSCKTLCRVKCKIPEKLKGECKTLSGQAVTLKTWGKGDSEFCLLQISAGASAVSRRGER